MTETESCSALVRIMMTETAPLSLLTGNPLAVVKPYPAPKRFKSREERIRHTRRSPLALACGRGRRRVWMLRLGTWNTTLISKTAGGRPMAGGCAPPESPLLVLIHKSGDNCSRKLRVSPEKTVSTPNKSV